MSTTQALVSEALLNHLEGLSALPAQTQHTLPCVIVKHLTASFKASLFNEISSLLPHKTAALFPSHRSKWMCANVCMYLTPVCC